MKLSQLIEQAETILEKFGDLEIDVLTETERTGQVEQPLGEIAVAPRRGRVKLLPEGFT